MAGPPRPLWELFEQLGEELKLKIVELLCEADRRSLRFAWTSARALVNSRVVRIALPAEELLTGRPLGLRECFPRLEMLDLLPPDGALTSESAFAVFAVAELAHLASLRHLILRDNQSLGTAAMALMHFCPQLQVLDLGNTGAAGWRTTCNELQ
jgi:hypothetical protein